MNNIGLDNLGSWSAAKKISVILIVTLLLSCLLFFVFLRSDLKKQNKISAEIQLLTIKLAQQKQVSEQMKTQKDMDAEIESHYLSLKNIYIMPKHIHQWIGIFSQIAQQEQLALLSAQPLTPIQAKFYQEIPLDLHVVGAYINLASFIAQIANLKPLFLTANFSLSPQDKNDYNGELILDLHLHAFAENTTHQSQVDNFVTPSLEKLDTSLKQDPFSKSLLQMTFSLLHLHMLGSINDKKQHWAILKNGIHIIHVAPGQHLDAHTQVVQVAGTFVTIKQNDRLHKILLEDKK